MKNISILKFISYFSLFLALFASCSSAPKRPAQIVSVRQMGENQLNLVNKATDQGDYDRALLLLTEARRLAVSTDDPSLRVRIKLSEGNILFCQNKTGEAETAWNAALAEAEASGQAELVSQARIYLARSSLIAGTASTANVKDRVNKELAAIKSDTLTIALGWTVIGRAEQKDRNFSAAEAAYQKAAAIHDKANYLEQAAYDWYLIASSRSVSGQSAAAVEALNTALAYDRRAENTFGLASDWCALGDVYKRAGKPDEADAAYRRAAEIFRSISLEQAALATEEKLSTL
jgi:tetratricopeptide (TPR) repeat protein